MVYGKNAIGEYPIVERLLKAGFKFDNRNHIWLYKSDDIELSFTYLQVEQAKCKWNMYQHILATAHATLKKRI